MVQVAVVVPAQSQRVQVDHPTPEGMSVLGDALPQGLERVEEGSLTPTWATSYGLEEEADVSRVLVWLASQKRPELRSAQIAFNEIPVRRDF